MGRSTLTDARESSESAIEFGFVAGLVAVALIVSLTALGDSWHTMRATVAATTF